MAESLKVFRARFQSKAGDQFMELRARNRAEAEVLAHAHQARRAARYDLTMERIKGMPKGEQAREMERRKLDFSRYDVVSGDEVGAAEAPLKLVKLEEVK